MLAIPVFRARVAPVLNWSTTILVLPDETADSSCGREIVLRDANPFDLLQILHKEGVETLICGALSSDILGFGEHLGLQIIHGVAGGIDDVLRAYREKALDQPCFRLPGCRAKRRYGDGRLAAENRGECGDEPGRSTLKSRGPSNAQGGKKPGQDLEKASNPGARPGSEKEGRRGPGGVCICPHCGMKARHEQGIPCTQIRCSGCNGMMVRG